MHVVHPDDLFTVLYVNYHPSSLVPSPTVILIASNSRNKLTCNIELTGTENAFPNIHVQCT